MAEEFTVRSIQELEWGCSRCNKTPMTGSKAVAHARGAHPGGVGHEYLVVLAGAEWRPVDELTAQCPVCEETGPFWEIERHHRMQRLNQKPGYVGTNIGVVLEVPQRADDTPPILETPRPSAGGSGGAEERPQPPPTPPAEAGADSRNGDTPPPFRPALPAAGLAGEGGDVLDPATLRVELELPFELLTIWGKLFKAHGVGLNDWLVNTVFEHYTHCIRVRLALVRVEPEEE